MIKIMKQMAQGAAIGIANIIPGVSGGTIAIVLGIYEKLIHSITLCLQNPFKHSNAVAFLVQIGAGAIIAAKLFAGVIDLCLIEYPVPTFMAFIGLIIGSIPTVYRNGKDMDISFSNILFGLVGFFIIFGMIVTPGTEEIPILGSFNPFELNNIFFLLASGAIAAAAMVVPGISGSFILLIMGSYQLILQSIDTVNLPIIMIIGIGAIIGIIVATKVIDYLLNKYPGPTHYVIIGLLIGSIFKLWPGLTLDLTGAISVFTFAIGAFAARRLS